MAVAEGLDDVFLQYVQAFKVSRRVVMMPSNCRFLPRG